MSTLLRRISSRVSRTSPLLHECKRLGRRHNHTPRPLPYPVEDGLGKFLPPEALHTLEEYQDGLLKRLNEEMRTDTNAETHSSVAQIALNCAERKERTLAFNYAVLAWNNSFFLENLTLPINDDDGTAHQKHVSEALLLKIRHHYGDFPRLKSTFSAAALGMFTNGWVWMVTDTQGNLGILPTYGPSTLLIRSRMNTATKNLLFREHNLKGTEDPTPPKTPHNESTITPPGVGPTSPTSGLPSRPFGSSGSTLDPHARAYSYPSTLADIMKPKRSFLDGEDDYGDTLGMRNGPPVVSTVGDCLYPLFCLPTYEHAWMSAGFGVWGKEPWITEFWTVLDWKKVSKTYGDIVFK